jgi:hypothetical protein
MNINELTIGQAKELTNLLNNKTESNKTESNKSNPFEIGENYFIRTVTMSFVGKLKAVFDDALVLSEASWVADSGRFHNMLKSGLQSESGSEIEPFIKDVIVSRGALIDATVYDFPLPIAQK